MLHNFLFYVMSPGSDPCFTGPSLCGTFVPSLQKVRPQSSHKTELQDHLLKDASLDPLTDEDMSFMTTQNVPFLRKGLVATLSFLGSLGEGWLQIFTRGCWSVMLWARWMHPHTGNYFKYVFTCKSMCTRVYMCLGVFCAAVTVLESE
jgi:hypothetical protein